MTKEEAAAAIERWREELRGRTRACDLHGCLALAYVILQLQRRMSA
jgi:hypothetical protein